MQINPSSGPVRLPFTGADRPLVQNLGPGTVYLGRSATNLVATGIQLEDGDGFEFGTLDNAGGELWVIAVGESADVRVIDLA
jgi:hypothetical protein